MSDRRDAFLNTFPRRLPGQSTSQYIHRREDRRRTGPSSDEPLIVRYSVLERGNSSGTSTRERSRSRERRRDYSQRRVRVAVASPSSHRPSGDSPHSWSEDGIGISYSSPRLSRPSHSYPAGANTYDSPRGHSGRSQAYETERERYPRSSTRVASLPYPPDTSPSSSDPDFWIARQFHHLPSAGSSEDEFDISAETRLPSDILENHLRPHVQRLNRTDWIDAVSEDFVIKHTALSINLSNLSKPVDRHWAEMSELFKRGDLLGNVNMSYLRQVSGWCSRRVAQMERLINSCINSTEKAERYNLSDFLKYSRRFQADVSSLANTVGRLADQQKDFLLDKAFDEDKIIRMATAREQAVVLLSLCERSAIQIHELAGRCDRKIEEELSRMRERVQQRHSHYSPQPRSGSTQRGGGTRPDRRASTVRLQRSQDFEVGSRRSPRY